MHLVRRCLDKSPEHRFQSARDLALVLSNELADGGLGHASGASAARRRVRAAWTVAAVALVGMGVALAWPWMRRTPPVERGKYDLMSSHHQHSIRMHCCRSPFRQMGRNLSLSHQWMAPTGFG